MTCPTCNTLLGALTAKPHCPSKTCVWTKCGCGTTVDRTKGTYYGPRIWGNPNGHIKAD